MPYEVKPLACDPTAINGMSERLIVSHYENNYGGAVQRLNAITKELAELDFTSAPIFVINGLKREELIAMNSMILHEIFFASLGEGSEPEGALRDALNKGARLDAKEIQAIRAQEKAHTKLVSAAFTAKIKEMEAAIHLLEKSQPKGGKR